MKLCERVTDSCHVLCDLTSHRPGRFLCDEITPEWRASGNVARVTSENTVTQLVEASKKMEGKNGKVQSLLFVSVTSFKLISCSRRE